VSASRRLRFIGTSPQRDKDTKTDWLEAQP
jgi:hypothetical protein